MVRRLESVSELFSLWEKVAEGRMRGPHPSPLPAGEGALKSALADHGHGRHRSADLVGQILEQIRFRHQARHAGALGGAVRFRSREARHGKTGADCASATRSRTSGSSSS